MGDHVAERDARAAARAATDSVDLEVNEHGGGAPPPQPHATPAEEQERRAAQAAKMTANGASREPHFTKMCDGIKKISLKHTDRMGNYHSLLRSLKELRARFPSLKGIEQIEVAEWGTKWHNFLYRDTTRELRLYWEQVFYHVLHNYMDPDSDGPDIVEELMGGQTDTTAVRVFIQIIGKYMPLGDHGNRAMTVTSKLDIGDYASIQAMFTTLAKLLRIYKSATGGQAEPPLLATYILKAIDPKSHPAVPQSFKNLYAKLEGEQLTYATAKTALIEWERNYTMNNPETQIRWGPRDLTAKAAAATPATPTTPASAGTGATYVKGCACPLHSRFGAVPCAHTAEECTKMQEMVAGLPAPRGSRRDNRKERTGRQQESGRRPRPKQPSISQQLQDLQATVAALTAERGRQDHGELELPASMAPAVPISRWKRSLRPFPECAPSHWKKAPTRPSRPHQ